MSGTKKLLDVIEITLRDDNNNLLPIYIDIHDNSLSKKWLTALNDIIRQRLHLEKNYCFFGFPDGPRNGEYLVNRMNETVTAINSANIGYTINNYFTLENCQAKDGGVNHEQMNLLHRYFEELQGTSGNISNYYWQADNTTRWHIRQLNLLCHEFESWQLSYRKKLTAPEWRRPSQLMCWLRAPRFMLDEEDYELFGIETIARPLGGVFVGVNKAVGKHHWEVFHDEGRDSRIGELTTTTLKSQTEAAGDFDIEWANDPGQFDWMKEELAEFRQWLIDNNINPEDKSLTIGHPQVGQVDLIRSFGTKDYNKIWNILENHLDVYSIKTSDERAIYNYRWSDSDYKEQQIKCLG